MPHYVITQPDSIKGIYDTWDECKDKIAGVKGAKHQKVHDRSEAEALLAGNGVVLTPGLYVFTDGNDRGGVGVVVVWMSEDSTKEPHVVSEIATSVGRIFYGDFVAGLGSDDEIQEALQESRNVLGELGGLYLALWQAPEEAELTIVQDYNGMAHWMKGEWKVDNPVSKAIVAVSKEIVKTKKLDLRFHWQKSHTSSWAGRHDFARFNKRADELATAGAKS